MSNKIKNENNLNEINSNHSNNSNNSSKQSQQHLQQIQQSQQIQQQTQQTLQQQQLQQQRHLNRREYNNKAVKEYKTQSSDTLQQYLIQKRFLFLFLPFVFSLPSLPSFLTPLLSLV